ncbi:hypothetical protein HDF16_005244 [Granulicella aggregans]|uniref:Uncharacterized protein n=1 Tax=Granulicella aggregans TaxID=474949 RepID=A0A7W7ZIR8_9BACT|nr:hypothetical protein [Granulicella aggregans]
MLQTFLCFRLATFFSFSSRRQSEQLARSKLRKRLLTLALALAGLGAFSKIIIAIYRNIT